MDTIEMMEKELAIISETAKQITHKRFGVDLTRKQLGRISKVLTTYQAEKDLLKKTQEWHEHGTVAPSCVGCATAEAAIEERNVSQGLVDTAQKLINTLNEHGADLDGICYLVGDLQAQITAYKSGNWIAVRRERLDGPICIMAHDEQCPHGIKEDVGGWCRRKDCDCGYNQICACWESYLTEKEQ